MKIETRLAVDKLYREAIALDVIMQAEKDDRLKLALGQVIVEYGAAIAKLVTKDEDVVKEREAMHNLMAAKGREGAYKKLAAKEKLATKKKLGTYSNG